MAKDNRPLPTPRDDDYLFPLDRRLRDKRKALGPPTRLPLAVQTFLRAMVYGVNQDIFINGYAPVKAGYPLSSKQAAFATGLSEPKVQKWMGTRIFKDKFREMINERRQSEEPENLATAIAIRDDLGSNTCDDRRVRLQAISLIRVKEPASAVNINVKNEHKEVTAGLIIKLDGEQK